MLSARMASLSLPTTDPPEGTPESIKPPMNQSINRPIVRQTIARHSAKLCITARQSHGAVTLNMNPHKDALYTMS